MPQVKEVIVERPVLEWKDKVCCRQLLLTRALTLLGLTVLRFQRLQPRVCSVFSVCNQGVLRYIAARISWRYFDEATCGTLSLQCIALTLSCFFLRR